MYKLFIWHKGFLFNVIYMKRLFFIDQAAPVKYMCISPKEVQQKLGEFGEYCPVYLAKGELVDCSHDTSNDLLAEYRGKLYKFASEEHLNIFMSSPSQYLYPLAPNKLPNKESLPRRRSASYLKKAFPTQIELKGYCPVTYKDGNLRQNFSLALAVDHMYDWNC